MTSTTIWLLLGLSLIATEFVFPTAFIALVMGVSALLVAIVAGWLSLSLQVFLWMGLSGLGIAVSRGLAATRRSNWDARVGETLTEILPGQVGRVTYEGNSWLARCDDADVAIAPHQPVHIVGRRGTTLLVMPDDGLRG
jgi:membrane protein implicated in regulation of membrane protease activity